MKTARQWIKELLSEESANKLIFKLNDTQKGNIFLDEECTYYFFINNLIHYIPDQYYYWRHKLEDKGVSNSSNQTNNKNQEKMENKRLEKTNENFHNGRIFNFTGDNNTITIVEHQTNDKGSVDLLLLKEENSTKFLSEAINGIGNAVLHFVKRELEERQKTQSEPVLKPIKKRKPVKKTTKKKK